jgi:hypothetical protein
MTRRRSVILTKIVDDTVSGEAKRVGEHFSRITRFALAACEDATYPTCLRMSGHLAHARSLSGQSETGTAGSITTSGWVMKKIVGT